MSENTNKKVATEPYKGVRDFYPEDMAVQNYIFETWRKSAEAFGYLEYGASVLEYADLYKAKSGDELVNEQMYVFKDKGDREVALRPEMTPTLARMIAAKLKEFSFPLRWYSIPNLFRYEKPQKGRTREHWQLNIDVFGIKNLNAEVEVISLASKIMQNFGFKESNFEIRINSRKIINYILNDLFKLAPDVSNKVAKLIDKKAKMETKEFEAGIRELIPNADNFLNLLNKKDLDTFASMLGNATDGISDIKETKEKLEKLGITNVVFRQDLMRGFDYYTGIVFEIFDNSPENKRAVFGGGRYDELLSLFGSEKVPAVGFGVGDVVIRDMLETYNLLPKMTASAKLYIAVLSESSLSYADNLAQNTRNVGINTIVDYSGKKVGDQIKYADKNKIPYVLVIGEEEVKTGKLKIKHLETGTETSVTEENISEIIK
jgi:histidyl-tRNA synthetase